jgi:hypothetical protein
MRVPDPAGGFIVRLDGVQPRLALLAEMPVPSALTEPDPPTGERWEWGQVWAHMVEFVPYWIGQIRLILEARTDQPVPFGRVKTDPDRIARIEAGRHESVTGLFERLSDETGDLTAFLAELSEEDWRRMGLHQTRGIMPMDRIVEQFLVGHLDEHAVQLESLGGEDPPPDPSTR